MLSKLVYPHYLVLSDNFNYPGGKAGRAVAVTWMLMSLVITLLYKCDLKAVLITSKVTIVTLSRGSELLIQFNDRSFEIVNWLMMLYEV